MRIIFSYVTSLGEGAIIMEWHLRFVRMLFVVVILLSLNILHEK